jgi:hypothetical protein
MSLPSLVEVRALVPASHLDDVQLGQVLAREAAQLTRRVGSCPDGVTPTTDMVTGGGNNIYVRRPIARVVSVVEEGVLPTTAYLVWAAQGRLERAPLGLRWGATVVVTYVPQADAATWAAALIDLVRLATERTALQSESIAGEHSYSAPDWERERARVYRNYGFHSL